MTTLRKEHRGITECSDKEMEVQKTCENFEDNKKGQCLYFRDWSDISGGKFYVCDYLMFNGDKK